MYERSPDGALKLFSECFTTQTAVLQINDFRYLGNIQGLSEQRIQSHPNIHHQWFIAQMDLSTDHGTKHDYMTVSVSA